MRVEYYIVADCSSIKFGKGTVVSKTNEDIYRRIMNDTWPKSSRVNVTLGIKMKYKDL